MTRVGKLTDQVTLFFYLFSTEETTTVATTTAFQKATLPTRPPGSAPLQRPLFIPRNDYDYNLASTLA